MCSGWFPRQRYLVIVGLFFSSLMELIGLTMIIPLLASTAQLRESKGIAIAVQSLFSSIGIPFIQPICWW